MKRLTLFACWTLCLVLFCTCCAKQETGVLDDPHQIGVDTAEITGNALQKNSAMLFADPGQPETTDNDLHPVGSSGNGQQDGSVTDPEQNETTGDFRREDVDQATEVTSLPIYGSYLQPLGSVNLYYRDNAVFAVRRNPAQWDAAALRSFSEWICFERVRYCMKEYPNYQIVGMINDTASALQELRLLLRDPETGFLYHFVTCPWRFRLVAPFYTAEEGREAFAAYFAKKEATLARLPVYEWKKPNTYPFINTFQSACVLRLREEAKNPDLYWYIGGYYEEDAPEYYDNYIEIPLLDEKKKEGACVLCLVYHHSDLLAELVLRKIDVSDREKDDLPMEVLYENAATRNPDGSYVPLQTTLYETVMEKEGGDGVRGVYFANGTYIPVR